MRRDLWAGERVVPVAGQQLLADLLGTELSHREADSKWEQERLGSLRATG